MAAASRQKKTARRKSVAPARRKAGVPSVVGDRGNWWLPVIREPFTGAWQRNQDLSAETVLTNAAVYACLERISSDIAKCRLRLVEQDNNDIWKEVESPAFSPVLRKPNSWQNRIQLIENWVLSKLTAGNAYILKGRDARGLVVSLNVLDPAGVRVMVTPVGDVYYDLSRDNISGIEGHILVPASEIIHDMMTVKFHPLNGVPPLIAATGPATQGLNIQTTSAKFFKNNATPGGVLSAPGEIKEATAKRLREYWQTQFSGDNAGRIAVLGDGLKFEPMAATAESSQLAEQLGLSAKMVASAFGIPAYMVGAEAPPSYNNIEALNQQYYSQCLQKHFEQIELCLDEGLGLIDAGYGSEFDLDNLLRMDTAAMISSEAEAVGAGIKTPNEARKRLNLGPMEGGDTPYLQEQNYSLSALSKRDAMDNPWAARQGSSGGDLVSKGDAILDDQEIQNYILAALTKELCGNDLESLYRLQITKAD